MPDEATKSLEEELDDIDDVGDVYEDVEGDASDETTDDFSGDVTDQDDNNEQDTTKTEEESDGEKKDSEKEGAGEETPEETDASGETESDKTKEGKAESETSEDLDDQQRIEDLVTEVNRLSGLLVTQTPVETTKEVAKDLTADTVADANMEDFVGDLDMEDFVGDLDMDDVASNPEIMNKILNKVLQKGIETGKSLSKDQTAVTTSSVSQTVASQVDSAIALKGMIDEFYNVNPELSNVRQVVQACASQIVQNSPDRTFKEVLNLAADAARKTLGIPKSKKDTKVATTGEVAFAEQRGGQRKKTKKVSKLQQELDEL